MDKKITDFIVPHLAHATIHLSLQARTVPAHVFVFVQRIESHGWQTVKLYRRITIIIMSVVNIVYVNARANTKNVHLQYKQYEHSLAGGDLKKYSWIYNGII